MANTKNNTMAITEKITVIKNNRASEKEKAFNMVIDSKATKEEKQKQKKAKSDALYNSINAGKICYKTEVLNKQGRAIVFNASCRVYKNNDDYAIYFSTIDKNARVYCTMAKNGGININIVAIGCYDFRNTMVDNNRDITEKVIRSIFKGLTFIEAVATVLSCTKKDGTNKYILEDISGNTKKIAAVFSK